MTGLGIPENAGRITSDWREPESCCEHNSDPLTADRLDTREGEPMTTADQEDRATRRGRPLDIVRAGDGDPRHGKVSTYSNWRCRCDMCRAAQAAYMRDLRRRRREQAAS